MVYNNNIVNNVVGNAKVEQSYPYNVTGIINGTVIVSWDNGTVGNYWSDYSGVGNYSIAEGNVDYYPLTSQVDVEIPEVCRPLLYRAVLIYHL